MGDKPTVVTLLYCFIIILLIILIKPNSAIAVDITISNTPSIISLEPFIITATISGAKTGTNYLRIDLFRESLINYFGETYNGNEWYNGSEYQKYFPISINSGISWTGEIQGRIGNVNIDNGQHKLRLRRYTSQNNYDYSNPIDINIILPTPTITLTPALIPTPTSVPTDTLTPTPEATPISYDSIFLSEAMVYPASGENEWVEIYNANDFPVSLTNWYIDDLENGGSSPKMFSLEITPKSYGIFDLTSPMFNNTGDSVRLLDFNKSIKDSFEYSTITQGKSYGRVYFDNDEFCLQEPSKGNANNSCINPTTTPNPPPTSTHTPSPSLSATAVINRLTNRPRNISLNQLAETRNKENEGEVLGSSNNLIKRKMNKPLINSLSFLSFSYSLLTIFSTLIKIKKAL